MQPTSSPVKVGVIGIGNMGWHHARVLSLLKDANLIGVADPNEERGKLAIDQFQCEWFKNYKDLIPKVDAICIAVPTLLHHKVGLDCLKGGANVLIEKPIAANELEAKSLIEAANASNCLLQVGHIERFNPAFRELNKIVHNEEIVEINKKIGCSIPEGTDYHTLAGFMLEKFQMVPKIGDVLDFNNIKFEVISMSGPKIDRVKIILPKSKM